MYRSRHAFSGRCVAAIVGPMVLISSITITNTLGKNWADGTGFWNVNGNWSPAAVPVANEAVNIVFTDGAPRTVTYNVNAPSLGLFSVDLTGAGTDVSEFKMPNNNTFAAKGILIGGYNGATTTAGRGAMTQSAGTASTTAGFDLVLGYGANSTGTYSLSGTGALTANQSEYVGLFGNGTFNHSAGTNTIATATGFFDIGTYAGSSGTYNLSGTGILTVKTNEYVGDIGTGIFNQNGGTHNNGASLYIGYNASGTGGTYNLSAGTLSWYLSSSAGAEYVGYRTSGTFNQSGGFNSVWGTGLHVGTLAGSTGIYTLSAGSLGSNGGEIIGESGTGTFTQTGGDNGNGAGTPVYIGYNVNSIGTYNLSGTGSFGSGYDTIVGYNGVGTFNQDGGTASIAENLVVGFGSTAVGSAYNLTAGSFSQGFSTYVTSIANGTFHQSGGTSTFDGGGVNVNGGSVSVGNFIISGGSAKTTDMSIAPNGVLTVSGDGVLTVTGRLAVPAGTPNAINLSGGTINTAALNFDGTPAALNWTSGTLRITQNVRWNNSANPTATADAFGFALALGNNQTLAVTGDEYLGGDVPFVLTLDAGSAHNVSGTLVVDVTGTIQQNIGSMLYTGAIVQAGGTVNGTLQNQTTFTYQSGSFNGRLLNQGSANLGPSFTAGDGVENDASMTVNLGQMLTVNGHGLDNRANFTLAGGTLNGDGPLINNSVLTGRGTLAGAGGLANNGYLAVSGGTMTLSNSGFNSNDGQIDLSGAQQLKLSGGNLANSGGIYLAGGMVSGTATLNNTTGVISGHGTIASPFTNAGLLAVDSGILSVSSAFSNNGEIYLTGGIATLSGSGTITNSGLLRGDGVVNKPVNNYAMGEIRAESGKRVKLTGANGNNVGLINLQGGTAEFSQALFNGGTGQIIGRGTLKVGGAGLQNNGNIALSSGISDVFGNVNNSSQSATKGITISGNAAVTFWNDVINGNGSLFKVSSGCSATFFGSFGGAGISGTGNIYFESDITPGFSPATVDFDGNVTLDSTSNLKIEIGGSSPGSEFDQVHVAGQFLLGGALQVALINGFSPSAGQTFDILDWGSSSGAFSALQLPALASGLAWNTSQLYSAGILSIGLPGDFNGNGVVDTADYVAWRKGLGTTYAQSDYDVWRAHFGQTAASGAGSLGKSEVPEPVTFVTLLMGLATVVVRPRATHL